MKKRYKKLKHSNIKNLEQKQQGRIFIGVTFTILFFRYAAQIAQEEPLLFSLLIILILILGGIIRLVSDYIRFIKFQYYTDLNNLLSIDPREFEHYICKLLIHMGYTAQVRSGNKDGGVDIDAYKNTIHTVVQCKRYNQSNKLTGNISVMLVRELFGVAKSISPSTQALFVTTANYSPEAIIFAEQNNIELRDGDTIIENLQQTGMTKTYAHFFDRLINHKFR